MNLFLTIAELVVEATVLVTLAAATITDIRHDRQYRAVDLEQYRNRS